MQLEKNTGKTCMATVIICTMCTLRAPNGCKRQWIIRIIISRHPIFMEIGLTLSDLGVCDDHT